MEPMVNMDSRLCSINRNRKCSLLSKCSVLELVVLGKSICSSKVMITFVQMSIYSKQNTSGEKYTHIYISFLLSVKRCELWGRHFTNFHCDYYYWQFQSSPCCLCIMDFDNDIVIHLAISPIGIWATRCNNHTVWYIHLLQTDML